MNEENLNIESIKEIIPAKEESPKIIENTEEKQHYPIGTGMKILFYLLSFLIFPGIVFGAVFYSKDDPEYRRVGKNCLYISLFPLIFYLIIVIIAIFSGQMGDVFGDSIKDIPY